MIFYILVFVAGIALSAFFSGSETGLYRVPRIRLVLDGLAGRIISKCLLWLANNPTFFVATVLVGNNMANYLTSFAVVMAVSTYAASEQSATELLATVMVTPIVFVFGELLPKYLFYNAPYRMLRFGGPLLILATLLFLPITIVLGVLDNVLSRFTGRTPFQSRLRMARAELQQVLREGHSMGLLRPSQQRTAQNMWQVGERPAKAFAMPIDRLARISERDSLNDAITAARRQGHPLVLVENAQATTIGYVRYADLNATGSNWASAVRPIVRAREDAKNLQVLFELNDCGSDIAELINSADKAVAIVTRRQLQEPLMTH